MGQQLKYMSIKKEAGEATIKVIKLLDSHNIYVTTSMLEKCIEFGSWGLELEFETTNYPDDLKESCDTLENLIKEHYPDENVREIFATNLLNEIMADYDNI